MPPRRKRVVKEDTLEPEIEVEIVKISTPSTPAKAKKSTPKSTPLVKKHSIPPISTQLEEKEQENVELQKDEERDESMEENDASIPKFLPAPKSPSPQLTQPIVPQAPPVEDVIRPRLVISKMVLKNFKSYAGTQEIGPFHKSFTSIVGPNGSGKSNVIDALLFVFGYRANKMRQGKLSELIHTSANHQNLEMCSVEIHFQEILDLPGPDDYEIIPHSSLVVSRQAFRNNASKYYINERTSSFTMVTDLLRERGIDLDHKRFLILQGEVESISLMRPKAKDEHDEGLLEYLEDIIGTSIYKGPIEKASEEVEKLNEERSERVNRVKYVEKEKQSLEAKKEEAEEYLRNENELAIRRNSLYQLYIHECNANVEMVTRAVNDLTGKLQEEQAKHVHIKDEVKELQEEYEERVKEYEKIGTETNEVMKELQKFEREDVQLQEKKKHLKAKQKKMAKTLEKDNHDRAENESWITNHQEELEKRKVELVKLENSLIKEEKELDFIRDGLKGKTEVFSTQIEVKQKELAPWIEKINAKQSAIDVAQSEYDILYEKTQAAQRAVESAEAEIDELKEASKIKDEEVVQLRQTIERTRKDITSIESNLANMLKKEETLRSNLSTARQKADEAKASLTQSQSKGAVLTNLMRLRDSGRIKGIYGRLGDLGVIEDKYDVAISTACPQLENIVVESVEVGQNCIEYLRKNNLGRAIFILLSQLQQKDMSPTQTPENVPRLFDLIVPKDPKFAPAFYSVLQNTLVADNLAQANRIAYGKQRWRVVTMDGQLIDKTGTMSGGGTKVARGGMSSKFAADDVKPEVVVSFERERDNMENEWRAFVDQRKELQRQMDIKKEDVPQMQLSLSKLEMDVKSNEKRIVDAKKRANELRSQNKPNMDDTNRMSHLEKDIASLNRDLEKLKTKSSKIEDDIKDLQNKILEVGGVRLRTQKAKVDGIREQIDTLNDRITKTQVAKAKAEKDVVKAETSIAKSEQELESIKSQLQELTAEIEVKMQTALEVRDKAEQAKQLMSQGKEELEQRKKSLDKKLETIKKIREVELRITNELEDCKNRFVEDQTKAQHWTNELKKLSLQRVGDDDEDVELELQGFTPDELDEMKTQKNRLLGDIAYFEELVVNAKPNLSVLDEYRRRQEEYLERAKDLQEITNARDAVKKQYDDLRKCRLDEFMRGFNIISHKLKEMYQMITLGGNAELELVDSLDPFSEGIVFSVMPPKKSWKNISNLSGGEKTLSSLALVFALHHYKPTPLYVMDEIDAALDFRNVSIVANYIKDRTKNAQFVIISLRNNMFELADRLVGIYKTDNCTKSIAVNPNKVLAVLNA